MPGEYNKINLQTSITDLSTIYYLLDVVRRAGVVQEQKSRTELFPQARARVKSVGGDWDPGRKDTHTGLTLKELGLIDYVDHDSFQVSSLGRQFLAGFQLVETPVDANQVTQNLVDKLDTSKRIRLLLSIVLASRMQQPEYGRDLHPYRILIRLLDNPDLEFKITKAEWASVANESAALVDGQFDEFVEWVKEFRAAPVEVDLLKTDRTLTKLKAWGLLKDVGGTGQGMSYSLSNECRRILAVMKCNYLAAIRTKPFILLAGISGTGKSRLVRQLARGFCPAQGDLADEKKPGNFEMIQVRPNWHDSTELLGYVSRASGTPTFVVKDFVKFLVKAWMYPKTPFFLCLDEMNLAPVEQYFAEYLSVIETRQLVDGKVVTDPILTFEDAVFAAVREQLLKPYASAADEEVKNARDALASALDADHGLRIPPNLVVMGTVNMDETTFSFSRKVLDRAMSFELNEVNMRDGLEQSTKVALGAFGHDGSPLQTYIEADEVYPPNKECCEKVLKYLEAVNEVLDKTPFKIAYRSRNEIMIYCVERTRDDLVPLAQAVDEATSMKILSRLEGDEAKLEKFFDDPNDVNKKVKKGLLPVLKSVVVAALKEHVAQDATAPICVDKLDGMIARLNSSGYTSFWS